MPNDSAPTANLTRILFERASKRLEEQQTHA
jgi:hypothetical protein